MADKKDDDDEIFGTGNENITIEDGGKKATCAGSGAGLRNVYGNVKISMKKKCIYKWKILINKRDGSMMIGLTANKDITTDFRTINYAYEFKTKIGKKYQLGKSEQYGKRCISGDTVEMMVDATKKELSYSVNGETQGVAFANIDDTREYYLVVCMKVNKQSSASITNFYNSATLMGGIDAQTLSEKIGAGTLKLNQVKKDEEYEYLQTNSPELLNTMVKSVENSFNYKSYSPFLDPILLIAWVHDPGKCKKIVLESCRKVLSAPIEKKEYEWFKDYVFSSDIWFMTTSFKKKRFMYHELINIAKEMSKDIINIMDDIYEHLQTHKQWEKIMEIQNAKDFTAVLRQDDAKVGLLKDMGFRDLFESKTVDDDEKSEHMKSFIDSNLAINILTSAATNINHEFQNHIKTVMSLYGSVKPGPVKQVQRCVSKLENDYQDVKYPKSAKLLDLVRCSITYNTVKQLIVGYDALM
eukprot:106244_1